MPDVISSGDKSKFAEGSDHADRVFQVVRAGKSQLEAAVELASVVNLERRPSASLDAGDRSAPLDVVGTATTDSVSLTRQRATLAQSKA